MQCDSGAAVFEFFAGGGLAGLGLGPAWRIAFANDICPAKARAFRAACPSVAFVEGDIWALSARDLPGRAALAWASFPCQDISLAGARGGLAAPRSGAFFGFWRLMDALIAERRAPDVIALENVTGLFTSNGGADLAVICQRLHDAGYRFGALEIDAAAFVPQSRPRAFLIATRHRPAEALTQPTPEGPFHSRASIAAAARLPDPLRESWIWWRLPAPPPRNTALASLVDFGPEVAWHPRERTAALLALMHPRHRARIDALKAEGGVHVGALFRRIRVENGVRLQRAEVRFDGLAGCLRTPAGGSSRQTLVVVQDGVVRTRLITPREAARLMGVPDEYPLPSPAGAALKVMGDGVAVPVVRWLSTHLLEPLAGVSAAAQAA